MKNIQRNLRSTITRMKQPKAESSAADMTEEENFLENLNQNQVKKLLSLRAVGWKLYKSDDKFQNLIRTRITATTRENDSFT